MTLSRKEKWPMSWREKLDHLDIGEYIDLDEKIAKSVACIASKHFHSAGSKKQFTIKRDPETGTPKLWRKEDKKGG